jgi:hypothetical protein
MPVRRVHVALVVAQPDAPWIVLGGTHVSTGQPNRHGYYITPTGVFLHDGSILDYRAQGTFNENHIRGLGMKGMRVWDFGWRWARKGWLCTLPVTDSASEMIADPWAGCSAGAAGAR